MLDRNVRPSLTRSVSSRSACGEPSWFDERTHTSYQYKVYIVGTTEHLPVTLVTGLLGLLGGALWLFEASRVVLVITWRLRCSLFCYDLFSYLGLASSIPNKELHRSRQVSHTRDMSVHTYMHMSLEIFTGVCVCVQAHVMTYIQARRSALRGRCLVEAGSVMQNRRQVSKRFEA